MESSDPLDFDIRNRAVEIFHQRLVHLKNNSTLIDLKDVNSDLTLISHKTWALLKHYHPEKMWKTL